MEGPLLYGTLAVVLAVVLEGTALREMTGVHFVVSRLKLEGAEARVGAQSPHAMQQ